MDTEALTRDDLARYSLVGFSAYVDSTWVGYPHAVKVAEALEDVERGITSRLAISTPPQHGKTTLAARNFVAWYLGRHPDHNVILVTYGAAFSATHGRRARDLLQAFGPTLFGVDVRSDSSAADHWEIEGHKGGLHTAGIDGGVTGHSCDLMVIDDPIKTRGEAESQTVRDATREWYRSSVISRRPKAVVTIMTRWQESDLLGWLFESEPGAWTKLTLPALAEENDPLGRALGEALCPAFLTREQLEKIRDSASMSSYVWSGMWQQRPVPLGGGLFKREHARRYRREGQWLTFLDNGFRIALTDLGDRFLTVDTATSEKTAADFTAVSAWAITRARELVLLDLDMRRLEAPEIDSAIRSMSAKWSAMAWLEESAPSKNLLQFLRVGTVGRDGKVRPPLAFRTLKPDTSKIARAIPASALMENGRVLLPSEIVAGGYTPPEWLEAYERQLFSFPNAEHDDAVDCTAYAAMVMEIMGTGQLPGTPPKHERRAPSVVDRFIVAKPKTGGPGW